MTSVGNKVITITDDRMAPSGIWTSRPPFYGGKVVRVIAFISGEKREANFPSPVPCNGERENGNGYMQVWMNLDRMTGDGRDGFFDSTTAQPPSRYGRRGVRCDAPCPCEMHYINNHGLLNADVNSIYSKRDLIIHETKPPNHKGEISRLAT